MHVLTAGSHHHNKIMAHRKEATEDNLNNNKVGIQLLFGERLRKRLPRFRQNPSYSWKAPCVFAL